MAANKWIIGVINPTHYRNYIPGFVFFGDVERIKIPWDSSPFLKKTPFGSIVVYSRQAP